MNDNDRFYPIVQTPVGKVPLIGATMTVERERELFGKKVLFATMSSGEFKKAGTMRIFSHRACLNSVSFFVPCILRADEI